MRSTLAYALLSLLLIIPAAYAQSSSQAGAANPGIPLASSDLIAWSQMQSPEQVPPAGPGQTPTPEQKPETQPQQNPTPAQPETQPGAENNTPTTEPKAQVFAGIISKDTGSYVLKVSKGSSYKLDDQDKAQQYDGQRVRVTGVLNSEINLIRVQKIEPLS